MVYRLSHVLKAQAGKTPLLHNKANLPCPLVSRVWKSLHHYVQFSGSVVIPLVGAVSRMYISLGLCFVALYYSETKFATSTALYSVPMGSSVAEMAGYIKPEGFGKVAGQLVVMVVFMCCAFAQTRVYAQKGFISIDCGSTSNYIDPKTGISYVTDVGYITTGLNANVAYPDTGPDGAPSSDRTSSTLRYFPKRSKNCYSLPVKTGMRYLLKAAYYHGGYDGKAAPLSFNISVDTMSPILITNSTKGVAELIGVTSSDTLFVCLIRISPKETPFISSLEYRPLEDFMYRGILPKNDARDVVLALIGRYHFQGQNQAIRYPDDDYDRTWLPFNNPTGAVKSIETTLNVSSTRSNAPELPPSVVMQSAWTCPVDSVLPVCLTGVSNFYPDPLYLILFVAEIQQLSSEVHRIFNISLTGIKNDANLPFLRQEPKFALTAYQFWWYNITSTSGSDELCVLLKAEASSDLGPLVNGIELYHVVSKKYPHTNTSDAARIEDLITSFNLTGWTGDACLPVAYNWLTCTTDEPPTVQSVMLSKYGSGGSIPASISALFNLTTLLLDGNILNGEIPDLSPLVNLRRLHLQNNSLSGVIPETLANIPHLEELYLQNNNLSGEIPVALTKNTRLDFRYFGNPSLCRNISCPVPPSASASRLKSWIVPVAASGGGIALIGVVVVIMCRSRKKIRTDYEAVFEFFPRENNSTPPDDDPDQRDLDIVFFHGLQRGTGDSQERPWETTWTNPRRDCWPRDWLPQDPRLHGKRVRVLSVSYNGRVSGYATGLFGRTADGHNSISEALFHSLTRWKVGITAPVVLVGFEYGGLVIQSFVVHCNDLRSINQEADEIMRNLRGIVSYDVPFLGTRMATRANRAKCILCLSKLVKLLNPFERENNQLSERFKRAIQNGSKLQEYQVQRFAFSAAIETNGFLSVPKVSAQGDHTATDYLELEGTNHDDMCKPNGRNAQAYDMFVTFLRNRIIPALEGGLQRARSPSPRTPTQRPSSHPRNHLLELGAILSDS